MPMWESVAVGLGVHLGKRIIDKFWQRARTDEQLIVVRDQLRNRSFEDKALGLIDDPISAVGEGKSEQVVVEFLVPDKLMEEAIDAVSLVLIVDDTQEGTSFLTADPSDQLDIFLPHGIYSFYSFLLDSTVEDITEADILAIGMRSTIDLSDIDNVEFADSADIVEVIDDSPIGIVPGGPYYLGVFFLETDMVEDAPTKFGDILGAIDSDQSLDLSGNWLLKETYEFGETVATVSLVHTGDSLVGTVLIHDTMDDGQELAVQQSVRGSIEDTGIQLKGYDARVLQGRSEDYVCDEWFGEFIDENTVVGNSVDDIGTEGVFEMRRVDD